MATDIALVDGRGCQLCLHSGNGGRKRVRLVSEGGRERGAGTKYIRF